MNASNRFMKRAGWLSLCLLLLGTLGCQKTMEALTFSEPEKPTRLIDKYAEPPAQNATAVMPPDYPRKGLLEQRMKYGVMACSPMEERLNKILDKIEAAWPGEPHPATAFIIPWREFAAYSTEDGGIFITYSMLRDLKSENEVAAVLAHEYSHVLRGHHKLSHADILFQTAYKFGSLYVNAKYNLKKSGVQTMLAEAAANELLLHTGQTALLPSFSREQEETADLLGTDLMAAAGYDPRGMSSFLQLQETLDEQKKMSPEDKAAGLTNIQGKPGAKPQSLKDGMNSALSEIGGKFDALYKEMRRDHPTARERGAKVHEYQEMFYEDVNRDVDNTAAWAELLQSPEVVRNFGIVDEVKTAYESIQEDENKATSVIAGLKAPETYAAVPYCRFTVVEMRAMKLRDDKLIPSLRKSVTSPDSLYNEHNRLIVTLEKTSPAQALEAAMNADREFEHPLQLLPTLIRLNRKTKNDLMVTGYLMNCVAAGNADLVKMCNDEAGKK